MTSQAVALDLEPAVKAGIKRRFGLTTFLLIVGIKLILPFVIQLVIELLIHRHQAQRRKGATNSDVEVLLEETRPIEMMPETLDSVREAGP